MKKLFDKLGFFCFCLFTLFIIPIGLSVSGVFFIFCFFKQLRKVIDIIYSTLDSNILNGKHGSIKKINSMLHPFAIDVICQGGTGFFFKQCRQIAAV